MVDLFLRSTVILLIANESKWNRQGVTECQCVMHTRETSFLGLQYQMVFAMNMNIILNRKAMFAVMNTSKAEVKIRPEKNSGLYGIWIHGLCNTSAVFCQLSQQANWELVITFVSQLTRELMNQGLWIFENHVIIWTLDKEVNMKATFTVMNTT